MEKFKVKVVRVEYAVKEIEVIAESLDEAKAIAVEQALDECYDPTNVYNVDYRVSEF